MNTNKANRREDIQAFHEWLAKETDKNPYAELVSLSLRLQGTCGLRTRESAAIKLCDKTVSDQGYLDIDRNDMATPRKKRTTYCLDGGAAVRKIQNRMRQLGIRSLIDPDMTLSKWLNYMGNLRTQFQRETGKKITYEGERYYYAYELYTKIWKDKTGFRIGCPSQTRYNKKSWNFYVLSDTGLDIKTIKKIDTEARKAVCASFGQADLRQTEDYLGKITIYEDIPTLSPADVQAVNNFRERKESPLVVPAIHVEECRQNDSEPEPEDIERPGYQFSWGQLIEEIDTYDNRATITWDFRFDDLLRAFIKKGGNSEELCDLTIDFATEAIDDIEHCPEISVTEGNGGTISFGFMCCTGSEDREELTELSRNFMEVYFLPVLMPVLVHALYRANNAIADETFEPGNFRKYLRNCA